jgi:hypothetical protein
MASLQELHGYERNMCQLVATPQACSRALCFCIAEEISVMVGWIFCALGLGGLIILRASA